MSLRDKGLAGCGRYVLASNPDGVAPAANRQAGRLPYCSLPYCRVWLAGTPATAPETGAVPPQVNSYGLFFQRLQFGVQVLRGETFGGDFVLGVGEDEPGEGLDV